MTRLRADHLGCYGYTKIETPNLDRLAEKGTLFEDAVCQVPITPPSHASMFTGTYPAVHQVRNVAGFSLGGSHPVLAKMLQERGWRTAAFVGSAVLARTTGLHQGFQVYDDKMEASEAGGDSAERPAGLVVDKALEWLAKQSDQAPFFLWVHVYDPHAPYEPPFPFKHQYAKLPYDGEIAYVDRELGRLFEALESRFPLDKTLLIVLADHGEGLSEHGESTHGVFLYDSTLRIPWIMAGPGVPHRKRVQKQARTIDLLPTLVSLLGGEPPSACQGTSLVPAFSGQDVNTTRSYAESLIPKIDMGWAELRALRTAKWKYIRAPRPELYNLENDPQELVNVVEQHPGEAEKLERQLRELTLTGADKPEEIRPNTVSAETERQLRSLGYVSAGSRRHLVLNGKGIDPKDRIQILQLLEEATTHQKGTPPQQRIRLLEQALKEDPTNSAIYLLLGEGYEINRRDKEALALYRSGIEREVGAPARSMLELPGSAGARAWWTRRSKRTSCLLKAIRHTSRHRKSWLLLICCEEEWLKQRRIFKGILVLNEENAKAHNGLGWIALKKHEVRLAREYFEKALQLDPQSDRCLHELGDALQRNRRF